MSITVFFTIFELRLCLYTHFVRAYSIESNIECFSPFLFSFHKNSMGIRYGFLLPIQPENGSVLYIAPLYIYYSEWME